MEIPSGDMAASDVDFGLRIGGRVKMLRTTTVTHYGPTRPLPVPGVGNVNSAHGKENATGKKEATLPLALQSAAVRFTCPFQNL
jgi:hypothetical protein